MPRPHGNSYPSVTTGHSEYVRKYGEVYAGGFGENGYPAVAYIGG